MHSCLLIALALITALMQTVLAIEEGYTPPLILSDLPLKLNQAFTFKISMYPNVVQVDRSQKNTSFKGNFSTLMLTGAGSIYRYTSTSFTFKYPPQHKITTTSNEVIEMQILYTLNLGKGLAWKHRQLVLSVSFVATEYAQPQGFAITQQSFNNATKQSVINFQRLLPLVPGLSMFIYKGIHSEYPDNKGFLWLVRKQLLLMNQQQFKEILALINLNNQGQEKHGLVRRLSDINEIEEMKEQSFRPQSMGNEL